jgi:hypothetical protein
MEDCPIKLEKALRRKVRAVPANSGLMNIRFIGCLYLQWMDTKGATRVSPAWSCRRGLCIGVSLVWCVLVGSEIKIGRSGCLSRNSYDAEFNPHVLLGLVQITWFGDEWLIASSTCSALSLERLRAACMVSRGLNVCAPSKDPDSINWTRSLVASRSRGRPCSE